MFRMKPGLKRAYGVESDCEANSSFALPRLWVILLVLALPFFSISEGYFEALERSGTVGAIIADMSLPASIICYLGLVFILKKHRI